MATIEKSCEILSSVEVVWALIADTDKDQEHWGAIRDIKVLKREGNTIEREALVGPRAFAQKSRQTIVFDPKRSIKMTMAGETMVGERSIVLVPLSKNNTKVDVSWRLEINGVPGFVQSIVRGQLSKATDEALKKFKGQAERVSSSATEDKAGVP